MKMGFMPADSVMPAIRFRRARMAASTIQAQSGGEVVIGGCQPIGHTASDELVYSMDCESLPAAEGSGGGK